jgi:serine/threonine protein kinase
MGGASADRRLVAGRYVLGGPLGRGGMGTVWRADDVLLGRTVAVKEVELPGGRPGADRGALRERALREARAAARLNHPGVVILHDVVEADDRLFLVMELVEAPTLRDLVDGSGPVGHAAAARVGLELVDALDAAHRAGIVHHDVKPANVMVTADGRAKLADFGIASLQDDTQRTLTGVAGAGREADRTMTAAFGSLPYVAPEQASGLRAGPAADLWGLGATLWFAVDGVAPFERASPAATIGAILHDPPGHLARAGPLEPVLLALLVKDPGQRPPAAAVRRNLEPLARAAPVPAAPTAHSRVPKPDPSAGPVDRAAARTPASPANPNRHPTNPHTPRPNPTPTPPSRRTPDPTRPMVGTARLPTHPAAPTEVLTGPAPPPAWGQAPPSSRRRRRTREPLPGWTAPPRRRRRWGRRLLVGAGVLVLLVVASNLGEGGRRGDAGPAGLGDPVRDGQFQFVVRSVDCGARSVGQGFTRKEPLEQFCLVALEVENIGTEGRTFGGGNQHLFDAAGNRHDPDLDATVRHGADRLVATHLNPGQRLQGTLVYDVPDPIDLVRVELHDAPLSGGASIDLG